jgi:hypothetical protein
MVLWCSDLSGTRLELDRVVVVVVVVVLLLLEVSLERAVAVCQVLWWYK